MDGGMVERNSDGRPLKQRGEDNRHQEVNLPPLLAAHLGRNDNGQLLQSSLTSVHRGHQPSVNAGGNLLLNSSHLSHNAQPFIPNSLQPSSRPIPTYVNLYPQPNMVVAYGQPLGYPSDAHGGIPTFVGTFAYHPYGGYAPQDPTRSIILTSNRFMYSSTAPSNNYPFYTQPMYPLPNTPACPNHRPTGLFAYSTSCMTPFVCWIKDYPLPDELKMPSYVGSYNGKGDPDNYLHLFKGAIRMQKWAMPVACHMFTYTLKGRYTDDTLQILGLHEEQHISGSVHGLKIGSLVEFLSTYLPTTYKGLMEKTYTWIEAREVATNGTPNDHQESFDKFKKKYSWDNNKGKKNRDRFSLYRGSNHGLLSNLSKSPREILATEKELKHQIKEAIKLGQLAHLVKGIKKGKAKVSDTQLGEWRKGDNDMAPIEAPILIIKRGDGVAIIKRRRQDLHRNGVRDLVTMSGHGRLKEDLESSTWRRR
ncbi:hypothetical protein Tco_1066827 [Tanacetum coccineum]|uniref:Uncharacterized protein n=1 Tax=Tanacetum coccineum TaxID=301880 RepID=A0ABQ5HCV8_9ASTR